eukprot:SAG11_NODE_13943_length_632_cov_0.968105_1_plen_66_part_01
MLSAAQLQQWATQRYVVVDNIWPAELIRAAASELEALYPSPSARRTAEELQAAGPAAEVGGFPWGA